MEGAVQEELNERFELSLLCIYLTIFNQFIYLSIYLPIYQFIYLSIYLISTYYHIIICLIPVFTNPMYRSFCSLFYPSIRNSIYPIYLAIYPYTGMIFFICLSCYLTRGDSIDVHLSLNYNIFTSLLVHSSICISINSSINFSISLSIVYSIVLIFPIKRIFTQTNRSKYSTLSISWTCT